jgi:hypothetical protein
MPHTSVTLPPHPFNTACQVSSLPSPDSQPHGDNCKCLCRMAQSWHNRWEMGRPMFRDLSQHVLPRARSSSSCVHGSTYPPWTTAVRWALLNVRFASSMALRAHRQSHLHLISSPRLSPLHPDALRCLARTRPPRLARTCVRQSRCCFHPHPGSGGHPGIATARRHHASCSRHRYYLESASSCVLT